MTRTEPPPGEPSLEEVLGVEGDPRNAPDHRRLLGALRGRREPVVAVTLLKTLGVAFGVLAGLIGIAGVVAAALYLDGWSLWAGTLGGLLLIFLGAIFALAQMALAHLVDTAHQALQRLNDLSVPGLTASEGVAKREAEQVALLREIRDAVQLTDEQKIALSRERIQREIRACVEAVEEHLQRGDFEAARERVAELVQDYPETDEGLDLARRVEEAEAAAREAALQDLVQNVGAALEARAWDQAMALAEELLQTFPDGSGVRELRETVRQRYDEGTAEERQRLYQRITDLAREHRWQEALDVASDLIEGYPESEEAGKLRPRIGTLSQKAGSAERRRLLAAVRRELGQQRWTEAYKAARNLVNAYPDSEEAAEVFRGLPNLRRLARRT